MENQIIGNLYENALKVGNKQDIPIRAFEVLAKEIGVEDVYIFENILTFERLYHEMKAFAILKINEAILGQILGEGKTINFIKSYLIDNADLTQTIIVIFF